jgi:hypothetical protein
VAGLSRTLPLVFVSYVGVRTPECTHSGLGSSHFARRYFGNRCFFLFLSLLRCFSSGGSLLHTMDSCTGDWSSSSRVSPFRHLRIKGYLLLPEAFRSLSRLSSALSARASTPRSLKLNQTNFFCGLAFRQYSEVVLRRIALRPWFRFFGVTDKCLYHVLSIPSLSLRNFLGCPDVSFLSKRHIRKITSVCSFQGAF